MKLSDALIIGGAGIAICRFLINPAATNNKENKFNESLQFNTSSQDKPSNVVDPNAGVSEAREIALAIKAHVDSVWDRDAELLEQARRIAKANNWTAVVYAYRQSTGSNIDEHLRKELSTSNYTKFYDIINHRDFADEYQMVVGEMDSVWGNDADKIYATLLKLVNEKRLGGWWSYYKAKKGRYFNEDWGKQYPSRITLDEYKKVRDLTTNYFKK
jgi:hypothetical protein